MVASSLPVTSRPCASRTAMLVMRMVWGLVVCTRHRKSSSRAASPAASRFCSATTATRTSPSAPPHTTTSPVGSTCAPRPPAPSQRRSHSKLNTSNSDITINLSLYEPDPTATICCSRRDANTCMKIAMSERIGMTPQQGSVAALHYCGHTHLRCKALLTFSDRQYAQNKTVSVIVVLLRANNLQNNSPRPLHIFANDEEGSASIQAMKKIVKCLVKVSKMPEEGAEGTTAGPSSGDAAPRTSVSKSHKMSAKRVPSRIEQSVDVGGDDIDSWLKAKTVLKPEDQLELTDVDIAVEEEEEEEEEEEGEGEMLPEGEGEEGEAEEDEEEEEGDEGQREGDDDEGEEEIQKPKKITNMFNFCERPAQTFIRFKRAMETQTLPASRLPMGDQVTQYIIYDSYEKDFAAKEEEKERERLAKERAVPTGLATAAEAPVLLHKKEKKITDFEIISKKMVNSAKTLERMVNQNIFDGVSQDYRNYEDPADDLREKEGTLLPLWKFSYEKTFKSAPDGAVCLYTLKNPSYPDYICMVDYVVLCIDIHPQHPHLFVIGKSDGNVAVYNVLLATSEPQFKSNSVKYKHGGIVWQVKWAADWPDGEMVFYSISDDGFIFQWVITSMGMTESKVMPIDLDIPPCPGPEGTSVRLKGCGRTMCFHPTDPLICLIGTEEGFIHKCNITYASNYLFTYAAHRLPVYKINFNKFNSDIFISCSAGWGIKMWEDCRENFDSFFSSLSHVTAQAPCTLNYGTGCPLSGWFPPMEECKKANTPEINGEQEVDIGYVVEISCQEKNTSEFPFTIEDKQNVDMCSSAKPLPSIENKFNLRVFVGNLSQETDVAGVKELFTKHTEILEDEIVDASMLWKVKKDDNDLIFTFVEFANEHAFQTALKLNNFLQNGQNLLVLPSVQTHFGLFHMEKTIKEDEETEKIEEKNKITEDDKHEGTQKFEQVEEIRDSIDKDINMKCVFNSEYIPDYKRSGHVAEKMEETDKITEIDKQEETQKFEHVEEIRNSTKKEIEGNTKCADNSEYIPVYKKSGHVAYLKHLPPDVTEDEVLQLFNFTRNEVVDISVLKFSRGKKSNSKRSEVRAVIAFPSEENLEKCLAQSQKPFRNLWVVAERHGMAKSTLGDKRSFSPNVSNDCTETSSSPKRQAISDVSEKDIVSTDKLELDLFVKHINWNVSDRIIRDFFASVGAKIQGMMQLGDPGIKGRGMCFVTMEDKESLLKGLALDGVVFLGNKIKVSIRKDRKFLLKPVEDEMPPNYSTFIAKLPVKKSAESLKSALSKFLKKADCSVKNMFIPLADNHSGNRGYAFVTFEDEKSLTKALEFNDSEIQIFDGSVKITVSNHWPENLKGIRDSVLKNKDQDCKRSFEGDQESSKSGKQHRRRRKAPSPYRGTVYKSQREGSKKYTMLGSSAVEYPLNRQQGFSNYNSYDSDYIAYLDYLEFRDYVAKKKGYNFSDYNAHQQLGSKDEFHQKQKVCQSYLPPVSQSYFGTNVTRTYQEPTLKSSEMSRESRWRNYSSNISSRCGSDVGYNLPLTAPSTDVEWAPYSSTVFGAATSDGRVHIFDVNVDKYNPICSQQVVSKKRNKLTKLAFNSYLPFIVVGDIRGVILSLKLSPNCRKKVKPPKKGPQLTNTELEVNKLTTILSHVREDKQLVPPPDRERAEEEEEARHHG
ncbi:Dynein intermediate chain 2, ciliary [Gryllus bimaculatus]|nr:Dynein intermediate chain 2, ciliary [Gryllus bimaculatus]